MNFFTLLIGTTLLPIAHIALAQDDIGQEAKSANSVAAMPEKIEIEQKPPIIPTELFAQKNAFSSAKLSPNGKEIAIQIAMDGAQNILLMDEETRKGTAKFVLPEDVEVEWFRWAGNEKLILSVSMAGEFEGEDVRYTRLFVLNSVTKEGLYLGRSEGVVDGNDLIYVAEDGSYALVSMQRSIYEYPSVLRFDLNRKSRGKEIQRAVDNVWDWYADDAGVVRLGTSNVRGTLKVLYRKSEGGRLELIAKIKEGDDEAELWGAAQIISGSDQGYVLREGESGRIGLYLFDYAKREVVEKVYENPDWDIDEVSFRDGKPVAAFYTDDRERAVWFDEDRKNTHAKLNEALRESELWVTSASKDNSRMLVWAGGEADPGALYIYAPDKNLLALFAEARPGLDVALLVEPKPVQYGARDGTVIKGYLTLPKGRAAKDLPLILMPHGGPYGIRDKLDYNDWVQLLANRGYAVLQPNYRGSGGYGEALFEKGRGQIGRAMQDDLDDAMDWAVDQGIADKNRVCVVGGSYGGYAALWSVIRNPERYRCAASWAGVTDWSSILRYDRRFLSGYGLRQWKGLVEGEEDNDLDEVSPYRLAAQLNRPLLLAHGKDDTRVPFSQFKKFRSAAQDAKVQPVELIIEDEGHSFSKAENEKAWFDNLVAFLAEHNPAE